MFEFIQRIEVIVTGVAAIIAAFPVATLFKRVKKIYLQLMPNGGSSITDKLDSLTDMNTAWRRASNDFHDRPYWECSSAGDLLWCNQACCDLYGLSLEQMKGKGWVNGIHPEDRATMMEAWLHCVEDKRAFDWKYRLQHPDNGIVLLVRNKGSIAVARMEVLGFYGTILKN